MDLMSLACNNKMVILGIRHVRLYSHTVVAWIVVKSALKTSLR